MKMDQTESSEMSAYKIQTPGNYPEENIQQFASKFVSLELLLPRNRIPLTYAKHLCICIITFSITCFSVINHSMQ
jgi:hypothetical protein